MANRSRRPSVVALGFRRAQARKGTQTPHLGRHTRPTGCQPCRTGGHIRSPCGRPAAWRIERVVSENPDDNSRGRPRKPKFALTLKQHQGWQLRIVKRRQRAFKITGLTWIVERSFAWLGRNRRLSKDYEYRVQTSETMIDLAAIRLMLNRIAPV